MLPIKIPKEVELLISRLNKEGEEAFLVGGCVRDYLLNIPPIDWDIATSATPKKVITTFSKERVIETGIKHGTVTVIINDFPFEVTTYRSESLYEDFRRPKSVSFVKDIKEDLSRRDFTINAMAMNEEKEITDFFGGQEDLKNRIIRTVGIPKERFLEDALRILRMYRFAARLEFDIEENTLKSAENLKDLLLHISNERIISELDGIIMSKNPKKILNLMYEKGIIQTSLRLEKYMEINVNPVDFSLIERAIEGETYYVRLALFYNTIFFRLFLKNGFDISVLKQLMRDMTYSNKTIKRVLEILIIKDILRMNYCSATTLYHLRRLSAKYGVNVMEDAFSLNFAVHKDENIIIKLKENYKNFELIIEKNEIITLKNLEINGEDLIKHGINDGKIIGQVLKYLLDMVHIDPKNNKKEKLIQLTKEYLKNN